MKQYNLTNQNGYVIKQIAKDLPNMPLGSFSSTKGVQKEWVRNVWQWLSNRKWPNGEQLVSAKITIYINKKLFGLNDHDRNHERRMRRGYLRNGVISVVRYLAGLGVKNEYIRNWLGDFKFTGDDISNIRRLEKKTGVKLLK